MKIEDGAKIMSNAYLEMKPSVCVLLDVRQQFLHKKSLTGRVHYVFLGVVRKTRPNVGVLGKVTGSSTTAAAP